MGTAGRNPKATERIGKRPFRSRTLRESFSYAWEGLLYVYSSERNMRVHVFIASLVVSLCVAAGLDRIEFFMVVLAILGVLSAEVLNSLVESLVDLLEPGYNLVAKRVKDIAAGGVLLTAGFSVVIGISAFYPVLLRLPDVWQNFCAYRWKWFAVCSLFFILPSFWGMIKYTHRV